ncbi:vegetative cell wall protein gp1-like [Micropterus salmoides]|uniref:vegetative cell wall protein gp1-like n=1 Tax=Micropterus salmoides TaxID=27706 RepID=UPI0018EC9F65|nr:vegetative cell wall protein gp1-like [Micropterus salmoides]
MRYARTHTHTLTGDIIAAADNITSSSCRFSDLFARVEEYEDSQTKPPKSHRKAPASSPRSRKGAVLPNNNEEESASSSVSVHSPPSSQQLPRYSLSSPSCLSVSLPPHSSTNHLVSSPVPPRPPVPSSSLAPAFWVPPAPRLPCLRLFCPTCSSVPCACIPPASTSPSPPLPQPLFPSKPTSPERCFWVLSVQHAQHVLEIHGFYTVLFNINNCFVFVYMYTLSKSVNATCHLLMVDCIMTHNCIVDNE